MLAALLQSKSEHQGVPPLEPAPRTYVPPSKRSGLGQILNAPLAAKLREDAHLTPGEKRTLKRNAYANARFPYTNITQVGYANAAGDVERNLLPRLALETGGLEPAVHPGREFGRDIAPNRVAGYAHRGHGDIWLTPDAYMRSPEFTRDVATHEFAHTRQPDVPAPKWQVEGGADLLASALNEALHRPEYRPGYPAFERRVRRTRDPFATALLR